MNDSIGKKISKLRKKLKMTQEDLAQKLFVTDGTISKWETGKSVPDYETLKTIAKIFDVKINYFLEDTSLKGHVKRFFIKIFYFIINHWQKIIHTIITLFLLLYFLIAFNSYQMYELKLKDNNFSIETGYYIKSKGKIVLNISNIVINDKENDVINQNIKLYTFVNNEKTYFYESSDLENILIKDFNGYEAFITSKIAKAIPNYLYIEVENLHIDNTVTTNSSKIIINKIADSKWFFHRLKVIEIQNNNSLNVDIDKLKILLLTKQFVQIPETEIYYKKMQEYDLYFDLNVAKMFYCYSDNRTVSIVEYYYNNEIIYYINTKKEDNKVINEYQYQFLIDRMDCNVGICNNYKQINNKTIDIYNSVFK